jgi:PKD repeat protein
MADTHGFEVVLEAAEALLTKVLRGAWKSAECPVEPGDEGRIPEYKDIPPGTTIGTYVVADGQVQIPQDQLQATMAPDVNGVQIKLGLNIQIEIADPPVPSAGLFDMTADVRAKAPVGSPPPGPDVGLILDGLPIGNVSTTLTSGYPLEPKLDLILTEFVHKAYENWTSAGPIDPTFPNIPHVLDEQNVNLTLGTADVHAELFDDDSDPARQIVVSRPNATTVNISIPVYLRIFDIHLSIPLITLLDPMGIETRMNIRAPLDSPPGSYTAHLGTATVTVDPIQPVSPDISGSTLEGTNYQTNKTRLAAFINLDTLITNQLISRGTALAQQIGDFTIPVPTIAQIEQAITEIFHADLEARNFISIWTPSAGGEVEITDVTVKALSDVLAIALNAGGGADVNAMGNFVPPDREFAIALSAARINQIISDTRRDQGLADDQLPKRFVEDGNDVDLNSLNIFLVDGAIRLTGNVTVIDALLDSIDVDADFTANVGLHWEPNGALNADGNQMLKQHTIGDPDVDPEESVLFWVITAIIGVLTFGLIGGIVVLVVALIVEGIASSIGGELALDAITGAVSGISAWPPNLSRIGRVTAVFHDPVLIDPNGIVIAGLVDVISSCEAVAIAAADSGGSYSSAAASALTLTAANTHVLASYRWVPGDGSAAVNLQNVSHTYVASGLYIAKHELRINEPGGANSRHFAVVDVRNVAPEVDAGPNITVNEGEVVTLVGRFSDVEYPDTHESVWNFGDDQALQAGTIQETNTPPRAIGTSTVQHAWCDNGIYTVALRVRDQNGGMTTDTLTVTVLNVPPKVDAGEEMFAYPCTVITLTGTFEDPGWCDTHTGSWDFGDCSPTQTAVVRETNDPPAAKGVVISSHVYSRCGTYHAVCTVIDDDGGIGTDATVIRVIYIENHNFELGYRARLHGMVANYWEPYVAPPKQSPQDSAAGSQPSSVPAATEAGDAIFFCEECIVHEGQRSQRIKVARSLRAGIYQRVGSNVGWDYQISVWYVINERTEGKARLGIDPEGGDDSAAPTVVWAEGSERQRWAQLTVRATAARRSITIFLETESGKAGHVDVCFDEAALFPVQPFCLPDEVRPEEPPKEETRCVDFTDLKPGTQLTPLYENAGFTFDSPYPHQVFHIVAAGPPVGQSKLAIPVMGLIIGLPFPSDLVQIRLTHFGGQPPTIVALNRNGQPVGQATGQTANNQLQTLEIAAPGIVTLRIEGKGRETLLYEICARRDWRKDENPRSSPS